MFRKTRNLHLWIGLITSIFILVEAVTGLMLSHPSLTGTSERAPIVEKRSQFTPPTNSSDTSSNTSSETQNAGASVSQTPVASDSQSPAIQGERPSGNNAQNVDAARKPDARSGLTGIIKGLHAGRLGNMNVQWAIDLSAISMIVLTVTGIYLSIKILWADQKAKRKKE